MSGHASAPDAPPVAHADGSALQRIYASARKAVAARIAVDEEIERRLAIVVLFTYGNEAPTGDALAADEDAITRVCVDRLLVQTTAT